MSIRERLSGNEAVAYAIKQINPDVMPAFPITPSALFFILPDVMAAVIRAVIITAAARIPIHTPVGIMQEHLLMKFS